MTFRSFSRFVRWYRWPMLVACAGAVTLWCLPTPAAVGALISSPLVVVLPVAFWWIELKPWPARVMARAAKRRRWLAARLRSLPLRGWTK